MRYDELSDLTEAPQQIEPTTFRLDDTTINRSFVARQLPRVTEVIEQTSDYQIVRTGDGDRGWIFLYTIANRTADYVVQYMTRRWNWMPTTVTQCVLWRDPASTFARHLTSRMFFDFLLPRFSAILSDRQQTEAGHEFWIARLADANKQGCRIGIVNTNHHTIVWFDPIKDGDFGLWRKQQDTFGRKERYQAIRYLIST